MMKKYKLKDEPTGEYTELRIDFDEFSDMDNPREIENVCWLALYRRGYALPNELPDKESINDFNGWDEFIEAMVKKYNALMVKKVYMYSHSGDIIYTKSLKDLQHEACDSGCIGFAIITKESLESIGLKPEDLSEEQMNDMIDDDVRELNQWNNGEVYRFEVVKITKCPCCNNIEEEEIDSCGGYYEIEQILDEFKDRIEEGLSDSEVECDDE